MGGGGGGARMVGVAGWGRLLARYEKRGGGVLSVSGPIRRAGGGGCVGECDRVSGGPGYSTVVQFMRADINRQRNRAAILYNAA